jgi:glycosyltransferase involved in cell wall biosynthesis
MNRKRNILVVSERYYPESFLINDLVESFIRRGLAVTVLTQEPSYPRGRLYRGYRNRLLAINNWRGARVIRLKTIPGYRDSLITKIFNYLWFLFYGSLVAILLPWSFDEVFVFQTGPLTMAVPAIAYAKLHHRPIRIWTQDVWPDTVYAYGFRRQAFITVPLEAFVRWVYRSVKTIFVTCTEFSKSLSKSTTKPLVYAPSWPMIVYSMAERPEKNALPHFVFAGNVGKVQNLENLIRGFAIARRKNSNVGVLRIVGDGSAYNSVASLAKQEGISVEMPGRKTPTEMESEYINADYLVLSLSSQEIFERTLPAKFSMYLSVGKPIVCAAKGVCASLVKEYELGFIANPDSPEEIARAFEAASSSSAELYNRITRNERTLLRNEFDKDVIINRILEYID